MEHSLHQQVWRQHLWHQSCSTTTPCPPSWGTLVQLTMRTAWGSHCGPASRPAGHVCKVPTWRTGTPTQSRETEAGRTESGCRGFFFCRKTSVTAPWYGQGTEPNKRIRCNSEGDPGEEMAERSTWQRWRGPSGRQEATGPVPTLYPQRGQLVRGRRMFQEQAH